jgi:hypothetical protein
VALHFELDAVAEVEAAASEAPLARGDGTHELVCPDQATADRVVAAVVKGGGRLLSMRSQRPSLEEYFLERFGTATTSPDSGDGPATEVEAP